MARDKIDSSRVAQALELTRDRRPLPDAAALLHPSNRFNERGLVLNDFEDRYNSSFRPAWARVWHIWHLILPRRAIDGAIVWGRVWRRHDGRRWIYKPILDFDER